MLTPVTSLLQPDALRAIPYYGELLSNGCDGINVLGTTGEAMSFSAKQRLAFMEAIAEKLPLDRVMVGTGAAAFDDALTLTGAALELGFAAVLIMPPFFFRDVSDEGVVEFFDSLFSALQMPPRVFLYNFPRMSGITFAPALLDRLIRAYPEAIVGMKDSSNDRRLQAQVISSYPHLRVFPGSEAYVANAKAYGAAGCISGSVCLWPELASEVFRTADAGLESQLAAKRRSLEGQPLITAVRRRVAEARNDPAWLRSMPPLGAGRDR